MGISDPDGNPWGLYETDGHALVVNAIYSDSCRIQFADPFGYLDNVPSFYTKYSNVVATVCTHLIH